MKEETVVLSPDRLGYKDRGLMKWQGLMLSDHNEALKKAKQEQKVLEVAFKPEMTIEEVSEVLYKAYVMKKPVLIQSNILREGILYPDVKCMVKGYKDQTIYLQLLNKRETTCQIDQIRNIEFMNTAEWYNKRQKKA
ncbi:MAG: hypothetical protein JJU16_05095 [Alkalibacterium sp.]|nr:hypothetical protein [Alkalibacterium sp.]